MSFAGKLHSFPFLWMSCGPVRPRSNEDENAGECVRLNSHMRSHVLWNFHESIWETHPPSIACRMQTMSANESFTTIHCYPRLIGSCLLTFLHKTWLNSLLCHVHGYGVDCGCQGDHEVHVCNGQLPSELRAVQDPQRRQQSPFQQLVQHLQTVWRCRIFNKTLVLHDEICSGVWRRSLTNNSSVPNG